MLQAGSQIGRWVVEVSLGAGGMGSVYRCHNADASRIKAAVKVLAAHSVPDAEARFRREAEILCRLNHPNIVRVRDVSISTTPAFLVMELIAGQSLEARLHDGPMSQRQAVAIAANMASAMAHAHAHGIFHRDIKPANILIDKQAQARIVDFGIAVESDVTRLTQSGFMAPATVIYAPPEWLSDGDPTPALWDIYSLGVVLYECLTGVAPFSLQSSGSSKQQLLKLALSKQGHPPLDIGPDFPPALRELVAGMTDADPEQRLPSMETVLERLSDQRTAVNPTPHDRPHRVPAGERGPASPPPGPATPQQGDATLDTLMMPRRGPSWLNRVADQPPRWFVLGALVILLMVATAVLRLTGSNAGIEELPATTSVTAEEQPSPQPPPVEGTPAEPTPPEAVPAPQPPPEAPEPAKAQSSSEPSPTAKSATPQEPVPASPWGATPAPNPWTAPPKEQPAPPKPGRIRLGDGLKSVTLRNLDTQRLLGAGSVPAGPYQLDAVTFRSGLTVRPDNVKLEVAAGGTRSIKCEEMLGSCVID